jgi:catechol 2,3-dioxygenase-like lactoylglutathione lyase family enzyme
MESLVSFHSPVLFVADIERSKKFYTQLLDFTIEHDFGASIGFHQGLSLWQPGFNHVITQSEGFKNASGNKFEICFETEFFEEFVRKLKNYHLSLLHDVIEEPWGQRTIRFYDPDGHLIEVGESLSSFVQRFYNQGMTIEQVSQRTSVSVEAITKMINDGRS